MLETKVIRTWYLFKIVLQTPVTSIMMTRKGINASLAMLEECAHREREGFRM
jgi:hypothetical protein